MYILNPDQDLKAAWYRCTALVAAYLMNRGLNPIHIDNHHYFFVKNEEWAKAHSIAPWWIKIFEIL
jgi:hypothetical protein